MNVKLTNNKAKALQGNMLKINWKQILEQRNTRKLKLEIMKMHYPLNERF